MFEASGKEGGMRRSEGWRWKAEKESENFIEGAFAGFMGRGESLPSSPFGFERAGESLIRCRSKEFTHCDLNN